MRLIPIKQKPGVSTPKNRRLFNYFKLFLAMVAVFVLGWAFGSGRIAIKKYDFQSVNKSLPAKLDYSSVDTVYKSIKDNYDGQLDEAKLLDGLKSGLARAAGDPYTEYFNAKDAKEFYGELDGTFEGIGAQLGKDKDGNIEVIAPISGFPAEKAGLKPKDLIAEIDSKTTSGMAIDEAIKLIKGPAGTVVKLTIVRAGSAQEIRITRALITIPSVKSEVKDGIGVLTISRFGDDTSNLATAAAQDFKAKNVRAVILDLRNDPGGLLEAAVSVSSLWLNNKTVLTERRDKTVIQTYESRGEAILAGLPTVVLINAGSASASEITAGALRDNNAATLIGEKSYGKGSVQQPINLVDGSLLKVTVARWYTPSGKNIDKEGITPDQVVTITETDVKAGADPQMASAISKLQQ